MLQGKDAVATIAVRDLETARKFYAETLGLSEAGREGEEVISFRSGKTLINIYRSQYAGSNKATALTWPVGDEVENIARALKEKGVKFEHYDLPQMTRNGDIHSTGNIRTAWFKDPDGNILNIING